MIKYICKTVKNIKRFNKHIKIYDSLNSDGPFAIQKRNIRRHYDWDKQAGDIDEHYFLMDLYMAKAVIKNSSQKHYDIGSRIDGFIAHLLVNMNVTMIDVRPLEFETDGLNFIQGNASHLPMEDESIESLSSLHALEHFGLGRYGDPIDSDAWKKALNEMMRVLKKGGILYLAVPVANSDILYFNAHRVFNPMTIIKQVPQADLLEFRYISNMKISDVIEDIEAEEYGEYSCGLFIFRKK